VHFCVLTQTYSILAYKYYCRTVHFCVLTRPYSILAYKSYCSTVHFCVLTQPYRILAYKSYCSTVHFRRITSIYQPTNAHIISHKTLSNTPTCFDLVRSSSGSFIPCSSCITVFTIQFVFANEVLWQHIMLCRNLL